MSTQVDKGEGRRVEGRGGEGRGEGGEGRGGEESGGEREGEGPMTIIRILSCYPSTRVPNDKHYIVAACCSEQ